MKKNVVKNLKIFACGALAGTIILTGASYVSKKKSDKDKTKEFQDKFGTPDISSSVDTKEKVTEKKYSFDYYGKEFTLQGEDLKVYGFDENGKVYEEELESVEVEKEKENVLNDDYVTEFEYNIYKTIQDKDKINCEYNIFCLFDDMRRLCEEILNRKDFEGKDERIEYIYGVAYNYISPDSNYTFGNLKFNELDSYIQNDIEKEVLKMKYIKDNKEIKEDSLFEEFMDNYSKIINYGLFNRGK